MIQITKGYYNLFNNKNQSIFTNRNKPNRQWQKD